MTVSTTTSTAQHFPNGVTVNFPFSFRFFAATDLKVFWQKPDGTIQLLVLNSNYTVQGVGNDAGGSITTIGTPLPNGLLVVSRIMVATQLTSFRNQGEFFAEIHEDAFDKLVMLVQQTIDSQGRGLTVPVSDPLDISLVLPGAVARSDKLLAFDAEGQPVVSNLTLEQIEQQPALAMEAAAQAQAAAVAADDSKNAAGVSADNSASAAASAAASAQSVVNGAVQLGMSAWGYRAQPFAGHGLDDGQELDRAVYPSFAAALDAGLLPTVTQAQWDADPANRACFVANSSTGKFRMRDRNGMSAGSLGAVFERGGSGAVLIRRDQVQGMKHRTVTGTATSPTEYNSEFAAGAAAISGIPAGGTIQNRYPSLTGNVVSDGANGTPRVGSETYPTHATGAWMTKLFGVIAPLGSAEAASLATAYASLASRASALEARSSALEFGYISQNQAWTANTNITLAHGLGSTPAKLSLEAQCITADSGYSVGQIITLGDAQIFLSGSSAYGFTMTANVTTISMEIALNGIGAIHKTTRNWAPITPASWVLRIKASKS